MKVQIEFYYIYQKESDTFPFDSDNVSNIEI